MVEASAVVYRSVEKALFTGATCSISSEALQCLSLELPRNTAVLLTGNLYQALGVADRSAGKTVVYQSIEKALFVGVTRSMSALSTASMVPWI